MTLEQAIRRIHRGRSDGADIENAIRADARRKVIEEIRAEELRYRNDGYEMPASEYQAVADWLEGKSDE
jgi:hypothetical protein